MRRALDLNAYFNRDDKAENISALWQRWDSARSDWVMRAKELRNYVFATDTKTTSNSKLPWKNSTTLPKLTAIRDVLHAHYMAALFPNDDWFAWQASSLDAAKKDKARKITGYMKAKLNENHFRTDVSKLIYDFIDYGNVFGTVVYEDKKIEREGQTITAYRGPRVKRISPFDIVFDPTVDKFEDSPTIVRSLKTFSDLYTEMEVDPGMQYDMNKLQELREKRYGLREHSAATVNKASGMRIDGFGDMYTYWLSDYVEVLEYRGDWFDMRTGQFERDRIVTIIDRTYVLRDVPSSSYLPNQIYHVGWRLRPDNLWAMGPLDNLVGMQYRIDHIENAKADAVDQYIHPVKKIRGYVEDFRDAPGERIYLGDDGDVSFERPDLTFLQYDQELMFYQEMMEVMAGAPKDLAGVRTPGNKTRYEVQQLQNNSQRLFLNKISYFEEVFLEKILNAMLDIAVRKIGGGEIVAIPDDDFAGVTFESVNAQDLTGEGAIRPIGARRFQTQERLLQDLTAFSNSPIGQDPAVNVHISGKRLASMLEELLGIERFGLVRDNIRITEQAETQALANAAAMQLQSQEGVRTELGPEDIQ